MKTIGLIGGMSWESTIPYYRIINEKVKETLGGLHSARIILYSVEFAEIEECQATALTAQRSGAQTGEPYGVIVGGGVKPGYHSHSLHDAEVMDDTQVQAAYLGQVRIITDGERTQLLAK